MNNNSDLLIIAAIVGQVITFLTVLTGIVVTAWKETRAHQWAVEERNAIAAELTRTAAALATNAASSAATLATTASNAAAELAARTTDAQEQIAEMLRAHKAVTMASGARIETAVAANTTLTEQAVSEAAAAYKEANTVNQKLERLGLAHTAALMEGVEQLVVGGRLHTPSEKKP